MNLVEYLIKLYKKYIIYKLYMNYFNILINHLIEIAPFYIIFQCITYFFIKYIDFNTIYFIMHFIVNSINTIILLPYIFELFNDPLSKQLDKNDWNSLDYIYPMVIGLHLLHLVNNIYHINYDEIIHHIFTHIFWYGIYHCNSSSIYIAPMITMSGIPGGITYLLLSIQKFGYINKITEKKISMYLNIWIRAPLCIIFSTLLYCKNLEEYKYTNKSISDYYFTLFMIIFTFINGVHFMHNIIHSYYSTLYKLID
jgi:hypothetical protein